MMCGVGSCHRPAFAGCAVLTAACVLTSCGNSPTPRAAPRTTTTGSTTTTTAALPTTTLPQGVGVPNVVGMKIALARFYLRTAGFTTVPLNAACNKGTFDSQSVVASLSVPGRPPNVTVGAQPLVPGTLLPKGAPVGITWSGCYPEGASVPLVIGQTFHSAVHLLHLAGLNWACYSLGGSTTTHRKTTTTQPATQSTTTGSTATTSTTGPTITTTTAAPKPPPTILTQGTRSGALVRAGSVVAIFMHHCPQ